MISAIASLLAGPDWRGQPATPGRLLAALPWLALGGFMLGAALWGATRALAWPGLGDIGLAGSATLACLALGLPACLVVPSRLWLLPLFLAPSVGVAGWGLLPLASGPIARLGCATALCLPVMAVGLAASGARVPAGLSRAAAAAGAGPLARAGLAARAAAPTLGLACALVFWLSLQLLVRR